MAGLNHTLNIAKQGLSAQQLGLAVTGHNISNVNNPAFSRQSVPQQAAKPLSVGGHIIGNGVLSQQVRQTADTFLESRLTDQKSTLSASEAFMSYMSVLEGVFSENTDSSLRQMFSDFWNGFDTLANKPAGAAERLSVVENGRKLSNQFDYLDKSMATLEQDLTREIGAGVDNVNRLVGEIAQLNQELLGKEGSGSANDTRDTRTQRVKELGELLDLKSFENPDGTLTVTTAGGACLVSGVETYDLRLEGGQVEWESSSGGFVDITSRIEGGKVGGWLDMRDVTLPETRRDLDSLARETIWNVNREFSRGAGTRYFQEPLTGTYKTSANGWLDTLPFGSRIDNSKDFRMWIQDETTTPSAHDAVNVDMGVSSATPGGWFGVEPANDPVRYDFDVIRSGTVGESVTLANGTGLGKVFTGDTTADAQARALKPQTLTVTSADGTVTKIDVRESEGDATPSAASIVARLNAVDGVQAYASPNEMNLDFSTLLPGVGDLQEGDTVTFSLESGGVTKDIEFEIGATAADTRTRFANAMTAATKDVSDLSVTWNGDVATLRSEKGENLGIGNFDVTDGATLTLDAFTPDTGGAGDVAFTLAGVEIAFALDATKTQDEMAASAMAALEKKSAELADKGISFERNAAGTGVEIHSKDGTNLDITALTTKGGNSDGGFTVSGNTGTLVGGVDAGTQVLQDGATTAIGVAPDTKETATLVAGGAPLTETGGTGSDCALKVSTFTIFSAPGTEVVSSARPGEGSIFNSPAGAPPMSGNALLAFGGKDGFEGFDPGDTLSFKVDGHAISFTVPAGATTDSLKADALETALRNSGLDPSEYGVVRTGDQVGFMKKDGTAIQMTEFMDDDGSGTGNAATLSVETGSGFGLDGPAAKELVAGSGDSVTSAVFGSGAAIEWKKYDADGNFTGEKGIVEVKDSGPYTFDTGMTFDLSPGTLVAGNTFTLNTDENGIPSPQEITARGRANATRSTYAFTVEPPGGKLGTDPLVVTWHNEYASGEIELDVNEDTELPYVVEIDGMTVKLEAGQFAKRDTFLIQTDVNGNPDVKTGGDWHWTTESLADEFNRQSSGVRADVNVDGTMSFAIDETAFEISEPGCSGENGFCDRNMEITVKDHSAFDQVAENFQLNRDAAGNWTIGNDYTKGRASLVPPGGNDSGFGVDLTGDGVADFEIDFDKPVNGTGFVEFDVTRQDPDKISFAFSGADTADSGVAAALGVNTFFTGSDAESIDMNGTLDETEYVNAGRIDEKTGQIVKGDNQVALGMGDVRDMEVTIEEWTLGRDGKAVSTTTETSLEGRYQGLVGDVAIQSQSEKRNLSFNTTMVANMTQQRDSLSAVSLDEEMVNLIKYQQAYQASAKLLTVTDEMLSTLMNMR